VGRWSLGCCCIREIVSVAFCVTLASQNNELFYFRRYNYTETVYKALKKISSYSFIFCRCTCIAVCGVDRIHAEKLFMHAVRGAACLNSAAKYAMLC